MRPVASPLPPPPAPPPRRIVPTTWILYGLAADQLGDNDTPMVYPSDPSVKTVGQFLEVGFG